MEVTVGKSFLRRLRKVAPLVFLGLVLPGDGIAQEVPDAFVALARQRALRITTLEPSTETADLRPLKDVIGQARVVALGEASHDAHEFLAFRNRLFEFLVEEMAFTAIALETGFSEAEQLEDYIDGGAGNAATLAQAVFCTTSESLEENRQLIEWMHTRNSALGSRRKVRLYGIDLTGMRNGEFPVARLAIERALEYLQGVDPASARALRERLEPRLSKFTDTAFGTLSEIQREALTTAIEDLVSLLERRRLDSPALPNSSRYENALRNAITARRLTAYFRQARVDTAATPVDLRESLTVRDVAMADNVKWVLEREGRGGRILVFAHNFHVKKGPAGKMPVPVFPGRAPSTMGEYLHAALGDDLFVLGSCFGGGAPEFKLPPLLPGSVDAAMASAGSSPFVLVLGSLSSTDSAGGWLHQPLQIRANDGYFAIDPTESLDALIFIPTITAARTIR